jgi:hypothetical protein
VKISDIKRNDLDAAERYYQERGTLLASEWSMLDHLQDDPAEFRRRSAAWTVSDGA